MIKVAKFGGSSVANATQFRKVKQIIQEDKNRLFVVTSACGKETNEDHKVTDLLYLCQAHIRYGVSYEDLFHLIEQKYMRIQKELKLKTNLKKEFEVIRSKMKKGISVDYLVSRGEYLTGLLLAEYLGYRFVDASEVICFDYNGSFDYAKSKKRLMEYCGGQGIVVPGFYGVLPNGEIRVMSRGGSDITGSFLANLLDADVYENWTDVSGIYVADPKIIANPIHIPRITYNELREISYLGANVLHDDAVFPVKEKKIPIHICNTNSPYDYGTMIVEDCHELDLQDPPHTVTGITGRKDYSVITVVKNHISAEVGFLRKLLTIFENYHISVECIPSTVDTVSVVVKSESVLPYQYEIIQEIKEQLHADEITIEDEISLVAIVGRAMKEKPGMSGKLLSEFGRVAINIKMISQSADELCILLGVMNRDFEKAIQCIYGKFIEEERKKR